MILEEALEDNIIRTTRDKQQSPKITFSNKCIVVIVFSLVFFIYRIAYPKYTGAACFVDNYHEFTYGANRSMFHGWDNTIIGIGQLMMDGWVIFITLYWLWNLKSMRFPSAIAVYFIFRAFLLNMQKFPFPEDIVWHNPGFISFSVPYGHTRDFYYSGHTGTLSLIALEFYTLKKKTLCVMVVVSLIYMVNMLTISRIHYTIDILGALIFAPFWFKFVERHLSKFDWVFSIFYFIPHLIYKKCKKDDYNTQTSEVELQEKSYQQQQNQVETDSKSKENQSQPSQQSQGSQKIKIQVIEGNHNNQFANFPGLIQERKE